MRKRIKCYMYARVSTMQADGIAASKDAGKPLFNGAAAQPRNSRPSITHKQEEAL